MEPIDYEKFEANKNGMNFFQVRHLKNRKGALCEIWPMGSYEWNVMTRKSFIFDKTKTSSKKFDHTRIINIMSSRALIERVQYNFNCSSYFFLLILVLGSSNLGDAFVWWNANRVQKVYHQLICGTVNKFLWISSRVPMSAGWFP